MTAARVASSGRSTPRGLWWISPAGAVAFVVLPTVILAASIADRAYRLSWGTPKYFTWASALVILQGVVIFMAASALPLLRTGRRRESAPWPGMSTTVLDRLTAASGVLFWVTILGYAVYGLVGVARGARPQMLLEALITQDTLGGELKDMFAPVSGVTTLTQVGIAYIVVATVILLHRRQDRLRGRIALLAFLALFRAFFLSERLAILELVIPVVGLLACAVAGSPRESRRILVRWAPVILVPAALVVFGLFEYSRSWQFYQKTVGGSFVDFAIDRFSGYYVTAYNNGQIAMTWEHSPDRLPYRTLEGFWTAPVVQQLDLYERFSPGNSDTFQTLLVLRGNPEFNNPCGVCDPFVDYGHAGALVWFALAGLLLGWIYRSFCNGKVWAVLVYPPMITGLFEMPRYLYWTQGRWIPALVALLATAWYATSGREPPDPEPAMAFAADRPAANRPAANRPDANRGVST